MQFFGSTKTTSLFYQWFSKLISAKIFGNVSPHGYTPLTSINKYSLDLNDKISQMFVL